MLKEGVQAQIALEVEGDLPVAQSKKKVKKEEVAEATAPTA